MSLWFTDGGYPHPVTGPGSSDGAVLHILQRILITATMSREGVIIGPRYGGVFVKALQGGGKYIRYHLVTRLPYRNQSTVYANFYTISW